MTGLSTARPKISRVAQGLALALALCSSVCAYLLPKQVTVIAAHTWEILGLILLALLASLVFKKNVPGRGVLAAQRVKMTWFFLVCLTPLLLHAVLYSIALFHFPLWVDHIATPAGSALNAVTCYWLLIAACVGVVRFFQQQYPHYFLHEACLAPLIKGIWRTRILDYGLYVIFMSQISFYALCLSSIFLLLVRILQGSQIAVLSLDGWYFSVLFLGLIVLLMRKIPWRKLMRRSTRWRWCVNHWLVLFVVAAAMLLGTPLAFSDWLIAKGLYTELHHYYLVNALLTLKENIGVTEARAWYLSGSLWVLTVPWVMSLYCRHAADRPFWWVALTICVPALLLERMVFTQVSGYFSWVFNGQLLGLACLFLVIYVTLTFRKQTNQHRFMGGWLPAYPASRTIKPRSGAEGLGRLMRLSLVVFLLSAAGLWPLVQLQVSLYAFGLVLAGSVIILSYAKQSIFSVIRLGYSASMAKLGGY